jgi:hypothetical protein
MYTVWFSWFSVTGLIMALWAETDSLITCCKCVCWLWLCYWKQSNILLSLGHKLQHTWGLKFISRYSILHRLYKALKFLINKTNTHHIISNYDPIKFHR